MPAYKYIVDFEEITSILKQKHSHLSNKRINLDSLSASYSFQVRNAKSKNEYGKLLLRYFADMQNGHTDVLFNRNILNCSATLIENRLFTSSLTDERLLSNGVQAKDEIMEIDGVPVTEWLEQEKAYVSASTVQGKVSKTVSNNVFTSYFGGTRQYLIRTADGMMNCVTASFEQPDYSSKGELSILHSKSISDSVGYIAINSMKGNVVAEFLKSYKELKDKPSLIIDVRSNGGGNFDLAQEISAYLIKHKHRASVSRRLISPAEGSYKGKLYVLTSGYTFSAAESFVIDLKEGGAATIVGEPTAGDTGNGATLFSTEQGVLFRLPTREPRFSYGDFPMEGKSIQPDHPVSLTVDDFRESKDTVLEFAIGLADTGVKQKAQVRVSNN